MLEDTVVALRQPGSVDDALTDLLRVGARIQSGCESRYPWRGLASPFGDSRRPLATDPSNGAP